MTELSLRAKRTIRGALSAGLAGAIALIFHFNDPYWSVVTVFALMTESSLEANFKKGIWRMWGTLLGAVAGVVLANLCASNHLFFLVAVFVLGYVSVYYFYTSKYPYAWLLGGLTAYMIMMEAPFSISGLYSAAIWRTIEVCTGVIAVWLIEVTVYPTHNTAPPKLRPPMDEAARLRLYQRGIKAGLSAVITFLLLLKLNWYGGAVGAVSAVLIAMPNELTTAKRAARLRFWGCFLGALAGLIALNLSFQSFVLLVFWLIAGAAVFAWYTAGPVNVSYGGLQGGVAYGIALMPLSGIIASDISQPLERTAGIFLGIIVAYIVNLLLWPNVHTSAPLKPST